MNKLFRHALAVALVTPALTALSAAPAMAAPGTSPAKTCSSGLVGSGPDAMFSKQGGCASTVATGGFETGKITKAGYVQQCQVIRAVEDFPFDFGYGVLDDEEVATIGECAAVLQFFHENLH